MNKPVLYRQGTWHSRQETVGEAYNSRLKIISPTHQHIFYYFQDTDCCKTLLETNSSWRVTQQNLRKNYYIYFSLFYRIEIIIFHSTRFVPNTSPTYIYRVWYSRQWRINVLRLILSAYQTVSNCLEVPNTYHLERGIQSPSNSTVL